MRTTNRVAIAALAAAALALTACGGGDSGGEASGSSGQSAAKTIKLGVLTTLSGPTAAGFVGVEGGVKARLAAYKDAGGKCASTNVDVIMGDDASSPQGALTATQKLIQQDKVYTLMPVDSFFSGAAQYASTQAKSTPVVGTSFDGSPQWVDPKVENFFSANGSTDYKNVADTYGKYWKGLGGTKVAVVGVATPSSSQNALAALASGKAAGLAEAYQNVALPIGSTDVGAIVLGIKDSGADVLYMPVTPQTGFAIVGGLKQAGVTMKSILTPTGYGSDLLANPPALQAAQGVGFTTSYSPTELNTEATQAQSAALKKYAGAKFDDPSFSQAQGWGAADLFLYGLEKAGCDASQADYIDALGKSKTWDNGGLYSAPVDFTKVGNLAPAHGPGNCFYVSIADGNGFKPDPKASPICGKLINK
jgi:branched-chain amino acid transport system substrate-binding protein